jgi:N-acetyl-gamma-glutamyl-phosphate reductase
MIAAGVFGATGYTGYELIQLLTGHPEVEVAFATSRSSAGQRLSDLYPSPLDVCLVAPEEADVDAADVAFFCLPHGESMAAVAAARAGTRCIDLSADFRLRDVAVYEQWYKVAHVAPELLRGAVYGLSEVYREQVAGAGLIANPGCYPTSVLLALYPLARGGHLRSGRVIVDSKSGVSGAGRKPRVGSLFCEVSGNFAPYSIGRAHRHLPEMEQELAAWGADVRVTFSPHLLPVVRGIVSTIYLTLEEGWSVERLVELYQEAYAGEPFVHVLPAGQLASLAYVNHTNRCALSFADAGADKNPADGNPADGNPGTDFIVVSAIDNLVKGASGQAVQNMNLMFGLDETAGLPR